VDFKLDASGDIAIENGDFAFVTGIEAVAQDCVMTLRTFLGESVYDRSKGTPWLQVIFERGTPVANIIFILGNILQGVDGVTEVISLTPTVDALNRRMTVTGRIRALNQEFPLPVLTVGVASGL
jgi:hypothetical protein